MAVFKLNICKFNNCNLIFNNLENLIKHIESSHINYDPKIIEQYESEPPACLPLSYVLRFFGDTPIVSQDNNDCATNSKLKQTLLSTKYGQRTTKEDTEESEQINSENTDLIKKSNSWLTSKNSRNPILKNANKLKKTYKCHCGKNYSTNISLKKHAIQCHNATVIAQVKEILQSPQTAGVSKIVQPYQSVSLKPISSTGTPLKTVVVTTKPGKSNVQSSAVLQPSPRLMIQISDLNSITSS